MMKQFILVCFLGRLIFAGIGSSKPRDYIIIEEKHDKSDSPMTPNEVRQTIPDLIQTLRGGMIDSPEMKVAERDIEYHISCLQQIGKIKPFTQNEAMLVFNQYRIIRERYPIFVLEI